jgi:hypothetical protein
VVGGWTSFTKAVLHGIAAFADSKACPAGFCARRQRGRVMLAGDLAQAVGELPRLAVSAPHTCLRRLIEIAAQAVPGCVGATSELWHHGELAFSTATHPDLAALLDGQLARGSGPVLDAVRTGTPTGCIDTLTELGARASRQRWPEYAADALGIGVRCSATLVHRCGQLTVSLTLYGTKPRTLDPATVALASLLAAIGAISLANASRHESWRRMASQLEEIICARAVVDQAKGLLMNAHGWNARDALAQLRTLSQTRHVDVTEAAQWLIDEHSRLKGQPRPVPGGAPGIPAGQQARPRPGKRRKPRPAPSPAADSKPSAADTD